MSKKEYVLNDELFVIPDLDKNFILFLPLEKRILKVNKDGLDALKRIKDKDSFPVDEPFIEQMLKEQVVVQSINPREALCRQCDKSCSNIDAFEPTSITMSVTNNCNLRCTYCYASAGDNKETLDISKAKAAIDLLLSNAIKKDVPLISITFHGGGEAFTAFKLMKQIIAYAQSVTELHKKKLKVSAATNGVLSAAMLEWVKDNIDNVFLSIDGPPEIQDIQRPLASGFGSSKKLEETIKYFEERKISYGLRSTITTSSLPRMKEIVKYVSDISSQTKMHFEPVFSVGRSKETNTEAPDFIDFFEAYKEASSFAEEKGIALTISATCLGESTFKFCGAAGENFVLTPSGHISTCYEVTKEIDPMSDVFFIGKIEDSGEIVFFKDKITYLKERDVRNMPHCADCFAKYSCSGDCLVKVGQTTGDIYDTNGYERCEMNRSLLLEKIRKALATDADNLSGNSTLCTSSKVI